MKTSITAVLVLSLLIVSSTYSQSLAALQDSFLTLKYGAFLHFNMGTFTDQEWASPGQSPNTFNPTNLDCGQWADAIQGGGMKYATLTTKHHDGFCLWNSAYTAYDVGSSSWKGGNGDVVREFVDSLRSRDLKVCFYYSIWDKSNGSDTTFIKNQLTELLTNYGPITALWFDGWGWQVGYPAVPYATVKNLIKSLQPECLILENNHGHNLTNTEIMLYERNIDGIPSTDNTIPTEVCCNIRADGNWFYHASGNCNLKPLDYLFTSLHGINASHGNYLLDLTPDTEGKIPQCQVDLLVELNTFVPDTNMHNQGDATYFGTWSVNGGRSFGDYWGDLQVTRTTGDSFVFVFTGTGVDFITEKNIEHGNFALYLDGILVDTADCSEPVGVRTAQQVVYRAMGLTNTTHRLKGVYISGADRYGVVDAFWVYPDTLTTPVEKVSGVVKKAVSCAVVSMGGGVWIRNQKAESRFNLYTVHGRKATEFMTDVRGAATLPGLPMGVYYLKAKNRLR